MPDQDELAADMQNLAINDGVQQFDSFDVGAQAANVRRGDAGDAYLKLAVELGNAAPASCRWAKNAAKRARTVLDGEDAEDAPMVPKKRKRAAARAKPVKERSKRRR